MTNGANSANDYVQSALESIQERLTLALSLRCSVAGKLQTEAEDLQQISCYELAFAAAEILAAKQLRLAAFSGDNDAIKTLSPIFDADALPSALRRLELIALNLGLDEDFTGISQSKEYRALLAAGSGNAQAFAGEKIIETENRFADIHTNEDVDMMRDMFYRFGQEIVVPLAEEVHINDLTVPEKLLAPMREMGVFGLSVPEKFGGTAPDEGEDNLAMIAITEALSEASLGIAGSLITRPEILTRAMLNGGTEAQKQHWLPLIAAGEPLVAIAITEPDYGSDAASLSLKGTKTEGGWLLNGAKTWCTFAGKAGVLMVVTRTGTEKGFKGLSILLAEKPSYDGHDFDYTQDNGGRLTGRAISTIGYRGMHSYDLSFEDFFVPDANVLGGKDGLGKGFYFTMNGMTGGRIQTAGRACGVMAAATKAAIQYTRDRKVFGAPLADYQLVKARLAVMAARYVASRTLAYHVGHLLNQGEGRMEASLAKLFACRSAELVTRDALQVHGGMGYAEEMPVSRYFVDARVLSIFEGAEETLALKVVARGLMQRSLDAQTN